MGSKRNPHNSAAGSFKHLSSRIRDLLVFPDESPPTQAEFPSHRLWKGSTLVAVPTGSGGAPMKMHSERISRLGGVSERTIIENNILALEDSSQVCREELQWKKSLYK